MYINMYVEYNGNAKMDLIPTVNRDENRLQAISSFY